MGPDPGEELDDAGDLSVRDERSAIEGDLPTMQLCAKAINARIEDRERRFRSLDSKAGLILGFDGLIVGFATNVESPGDVALASQAASAFSGLLAAIVLVCRRGAVALEPQRSKSWQRCPRGMRFQRSSARQFGLTRRTRSG